MGFLFMQNAYWLEKFIQYRTSPLGFQIAQTLITAKIEQQIKLLQRYSFSFPLSPTLKNKTIREIFLREARFAHYYWTTLRTHLKNKILFLHRKPREKSPGNQLLDIGYHQLMNILEKRMLELAIPTDLGILHKAQKMKGQPLLYDLIEPWRPLLVDRNWIKYILRKKKKIEIIKKEMISHFVYLIQNSLKKQYYFAPYKKCITLDYWIYLYLQNFYNAVKENKPFKPYLPSWRHENRCNID